MKTAGPIFFACVLALPIFSCQRIKVAEINAPFTMSFEAPAASEEKEFEYETTVTATDYPEFNNNKDKLQTLSLAGASFEVNEVRAGEGVSLSLALYVADTSRNYGLITELKDVELRSGGYYDLPMDEAAKNQLAEWIRSAPYVLNMKITGSANGVPYDATFRIKISVNQKVKVLI